MNSEPEESGMQRISGDLRSDSPGIHDFRSALERYLEKTEEGFGIRCRLTMEELKGVLSEDQERTVYRLIQEGVNNAVRHSGATRVEVSLRLFSGELVTRVEDDGRGISQEEIEDRQAWGLMGMREHLGALRGRLDIRGIPGDGTSLIMRFPL